MTATHIDDDYWDNISSEAKLAATTGLLESDCPYRPGSAEQWEWQCEFNVCRRQPYQDAGVAAA